MSRKRKLLSLYKSEMEQIRFVPKLVHPVPQVGATVFQVFGITRLRMEPQLAIFDGTRSEALGHSAGQINSTIL